MNRQQFCTIYPDENGVIFEIMAYYNLTEEECRQRVAAYLKTNPQKLYYARLGRKGTN
jgi:hypothetical protein